MKNKKSSNQDNYNSFYRKPHLCPYEPVQGMHLTLAERAVANTHFSLHQLRNRESYARCVWRTRQAAADVERLEARQGGSPLKSSWEPVNIGLKKNSKRCSDYLFPMKKSKCGSKTKKKQDARKTSHTKDSSGSKNKAKVQPSTPSNYTRTAPTRLVKSSEEWKGNTKEDAAHDSRKTQSDYGTSVNRPINTATEGILRPHKTYPTSEPNITNAHLADQQSISESGDECSTSVSDAEDMKRVRFSQSYPNYQETSILKNDDIRSNVDQSEKHSTYKYQSYEPDSQGTLRPCTNTYEVQHSSSVGITPFNALTNTPSQFQITNQVFLRPSRYPFSSPDRVSELPQNSATGSDGQTPNVSTFENRQTYIHPTGENGGDKWDTTKVQLPNNEKYARNNVVAGDSCGKAYEADKYQLNHRTENATHSIMEPTEKHFPYSPSKYDDKTYELNNKTQEQHMVSSPISRGPSNTIETRRRSEQPVTRDFCAELFARNARAAKSTDSVDSNQGTKINTRHQSPARERNIHDLQGNRSNNNNTHQTSQPLKTDRRPCTEPVSKNRGPHNFQDVEKPLDTRVEKDSYGRTMYNPLRQPGGYDPHNKVESYGSRCEKTVTSQPVPSMRRTSDEYSSRYVASSRFQRPFNELSNNCDGEQGTEEGLSIKRDFRSTNQSSMGKRSAEQVSDPKYDTYRDDSLRCGIQVKPTVDPQNTPLEFLHSHSPLRYSSQPNKTFETTENAPLPRRQVDLPMHFQNRNAAEASIPPSELHLPYNEKEGVIDRTERFTGIGHSSDEVQNRRSFGSGASQSFDPSPFETGYDSTPGFPSHLETPEHHPYKHDVKGDTNNHKSDTFYKPQSTETSSHQLRHGIVKSTPTISVQVKPKCKDTSQTNRKVQFDNIISREGSGIASKNANETEQRKKKDDAMEMRVTTNFGNTIQSGIGQGKGIVQLTIGEDAEGQQGSSGQKKIIMQQPFPGSFEIRTEDGASIELGKQAMLVWPALALLLMSISNAAENKNQ